MPVNPETNGHNSINVDITESDISAVLRTKINYITQLELQVMALSRSLGDKEARINELEAEKEPVATE
jgi:hypothetical protein|tara:strand:- start:316 stop:519 length:204 start_codon:yes stop_codon:yes gene_type:complete